MIKASDERTGPTTIILVNASPIKSREWDKIKKVMDSTPIRVIVVTYANDSLGGQQLIQLSQYGGIYKVPDGNNDLEQNEILNNIFLRIINENIGTPLNKVRILIIYIYKFYF